jgi:energy-coupling factor transport system permease protein
MYLYREANTIFHALHPVTKLLLLFLMIAIPFPARTLLLIVAVFLLYVILLCFAKGAKNLAKFWKLLTTFWIFTFFIWIVIPQLRHWPWSFETAAVLATRIDSFVLSGLFFVTITRLEEFTLALTRIGIPYKGAFALSLGFRLVPLFYQNLQTIVAAQKSRGVDLDSGGPLQKGNKYAAIITALMSYSIRNADLMAMSLEAKGFGYTNHRTSYLQPRFGLYDAIVLIFAVASLVLLLAIT